MSQNSSVKEPLKYGSLMSINCGSYFFYEKYSRTCVAELGLVFCSTQFATEVMSLTSKKCCESSCRIKGLQKRAIENQFQAIPISFTCKFQVQKNTYVWEYDWFLNIIGKNIISILNYENQTINKILLRNEVFEKSSHKLFSLFGVY